MLLQAGLPLTKNNLSLTTFGNDVGTAADSQASNTFDIYIQETNKNTQACRHIDGKTVKQRNKKLTNKEKRLEHGAVF